MFLNKLYKILPFFKIYLSICLSLSVCLSVCLSVYLSVYIISALGKLHVDLWLFMCVASYTISLFWDIMQSWPLAE